MWFGYPKLPVHLWEVERNIFFLYSFLNIVGVLKVDMIQNYIIKNEEFLKKIRNHIKY